MGNKIQRLFIKQFASFLEHPERCPTRSSYMLACGLHLCPLEKRPAALYRKKDIIPPTRSALLVEHGPLSPIQLAALPHCWQRPLWKAW
ncbi:uncharacterized protein YALI1_C11057g [Yarrowia lipolytica]|uniref:Uncharacterized protein n=1 Tax=Yarrowia lipolytica TaxID=4952 RepID=A0A1D8NA47_YARLL|nr:hypothetical protein YALI1_C11057g [Yarrowia lipolytica]